MDQRFVFLTLLVKLGVAAAISAALVRSWEFHSRLFREERRTNFDVIFLTVAMSVPYALGVLVREMVRNFQAADNSIEGAIIVGVIAGPWPGALAGVLLSIPSFFYGEWISLPFYIFVGLVAGSLRELAGKWADKEEIWSFSPFFDLTIFRWIRRNIPRPQRDWQIAFFVVIVLLQMARMEIARLFPGKLFAVTVTHDQPWTYLAILSVTVMCVALPLKIWNNTRIELKLEEQNRLLLQTRLDALQSQINPHFLFNTLNSVASLVRVDPDTARDLIVKLANILRSLLRKHDAFSTLAEELDFIDDYLDIEVIRFGRDKLQVIKELDPDSLDCIVPNMLLQPLVENSIKHGLSPKIDGGSIILRSSLANDRLTIQVEDDGVGMETQSSAGGTGIGLKNVAERIQVLYSEAGRMDIRAPRSGIGTLITIELPMIETEIARSAAEKIYEERSRTRS